VHINIFFLKPNIDERVDFIVEHCIIILVFFVLIVFCELLNMRSYGHQKIVCCVLCVH